MFTFARARALVLAIVAGGVGACLPAHALAPGYPLVTSYSALDIKADATGWTALQDAAGVLYFGCENLVTFDGDRWRESPLPGAHTIRSLAFGQDGRLWAAATGDVGWFERAVDRWTFHSLREFIPPEHRTLGDVWHVFAEDNGALFVADERILRWDGRSFRGWTMPGTRHLRAFRVDGHLFVQHKPTGLYRIGEAGPELHFAASSIGTAGIFWIERRGAAWFLLTSEGLFTLSNGQRQEISGRAGDFLRANSPSFVAQLNDGRLAVATVRDGIALIRPDGALERVISEADGLPTRLITGLFVDRDGALWATSLAHLTRIAVNAPSTVFDARAALPNKPYHTLAAANGRLFAATDDAVYELPEGGRRFAPIEALRGRVSELRAASGGLLASGYHGVKRLSPTGASVVYATDSDTFSVLPQGDGGLLVADNRRIVMVDATGTARTLVKDLPEIATSLATDWKGHLWIGTKSNGILVASPHGSDPVAAESAAQRLGLPMIKGASLTRTGPDGTLYLLSSAGAWILRRHANAFEAVDHFSRRTPIAAAEAAADGTLWIVQEGIAGGPPCVARVSTRTGRPRWQPHSVEGLSSIGAPLALMAEAAGAESVLWIGGTNGILRHEVSHGPVAPIPAPPVLQTHLRTADSEKPQSLAASLPYSTRAVVFEFAAPDFARRPELRLETRIDGIDRDWVPADASSRRELTAIRDGTYTFRVRTVAETGVASAPTVQTFQVLPPWWRTAPAILGGLLALAPLGYGVYRFRVRSLQRRTEQLEEKVRQRTKEYEEASAAKTQFVANMSHDIRNPLNGIVGLALALEDTRLDSRQREIVATLRECTTYLSSLVDDVLDFASIEAGRVELRPGTFVAAELLHSVVTTLMADTEERGATLLVTADPALPAMLQGDAGRIQQILVNYVSNALKYAGGKIRLSAAISPESPGEIEFAVADEGPGFDAAEQAALFTKFSRLAAARREDVPGAGLGLAACRLLADLMGGSVGVESRPGCGARFILRLPLTVAPEPVGLAAMDLPNTTVLLVEDTDYNAWAATAVLSRLGLSCERARTGTDALRVFGERRFNLVLLDRSLPDMDGTEVARRMRQMESDGSQAVLLAVTAYCTSEDRARCLESGMDAFVGKPLTPEKLRKVLMAAGRRQLAAASVHVPPEVPAAVLDMSLLNYLSSGTEESLETQVQRFLATLSETESEMARAARARDFGSLGVCAHRVLGQAKMIGGATLADAASRLEAAAQSRDGSACGEWLRQVGEEIRAVTAALRHRHRTGQPV